MKQKLLRIGLFVLVLAGLLTAGYFWNEHENRARQVSSGAVSSWPAVLPKALLLQSETIQKTQTTDDASKLTTVSLLSTDSVENIYKAYLDVFKNDYAFANKNLGSSSANMYVLSRDGQQSINIVIFKNDANAQTQVSIASSERVK